MRNKKDRRLNIGFFAGIMEDIYQSRISNNLAAYAEELDINLNIILGSSLNSPLWYEKEHNIVYNIINNEYLDGLLILSGPMVNFISHKELIDFLKQFKLIPTVTIAQKIENLPTVKINNSNAVIEEIDHLINVHGYKKIMYIQGAFSNLEAVERYEAFKKSMKKNNLKIDENLIYQGNFIFESGEEAVKEIIIKKKHDVDVIVAANDEMAFGAITVLKEHGYKIPNDIAVVGFDDIIMSKYSNPTLTTVAQPFEKQTRDALDLLIKIINDGEDIHDIELDSKFLIRKSCGCMTNLKISDDLKKDISNLPLITDNKNNEIINMILKKFNFTKHEESVISNWVNNLIILIEKIIKNNENYEKFLKKLFDIPFKKFTYYYDIYIYNDLIIEIFRYFYNLKTDDKVKFKINTLFYESINNIKETVLHPYLFESINKTHASWVLRDVNSNIITKFKFSDLLQSLKEELIKININTCYVTLYDSEPEVKNFIQWKIPEYSNLIFAFIDKKEKIIKNEKFITTDLLPEEYLPKNRRYTFIVMPLFHHKKQLGIIIFEMSSKNNKIYETLRMIISSAIVSVLSVEELNKAKLLAENANRAKSNFLTNMSHEIRTPMNSILGFTDILLEEIKNEKHLQYLNKIDGSGKKLLNIINDILDFAKIESDKIEILVNNFLIRNLLKNIQQLFKQVADQKKIKFNIIIHSNVPKILIGDDYRLHQVLVNLIDNAFKFTKKGSVTIECSYNEKILNILISDTGIGIPENKYETIFSGFSQVDSSSTREYGGTGLGLSIAYSLIKKMNGELSFKSKINKGTTFNIKLPINFFKKNQEDKVIQKEDDIKNKKLNILIAEDNEMNRSFIDVLFKKINNIKYEFAENGKQVLNILENKKGEIDLLFLDMKMPVLNGMETLKIIKKNNNYKKLYIIALTANAMEGDKERYLEAGCDDYIAKPINKEVLINKIKNYLKKS